MDEQLLNQIKEDIEQIRAKASLHYSYTNAKLDKVLEVSIELLNRQFALENQLGGIENKLTGVSNG